MDGQIVNKGWQTEYHKYDRQLTEQFFHGLHNKVIIGEILRKLTELEDIDDATSKEVIILA